MRALVLEHLRSNPVGLYGDLLAERGIVFDRVLLDAGDPLPDWRRYDLLVVMGGGMSAYQEDDYPWLVREKTAIREAVHAGVPYFGVCLGSQLLASALGARVYRGAAPELGVNPVLLTEAARRDPVFRGFPADLEAFEWHSDTFELPEGAVLLARSPRYENQAYRLGRVAYAIQCHLEPTLEDVRDWFAAWPSLLDTFEERHGTGSVDRFFTDYAETIPLLHRTARQLFARWLEHSLAGGRLTLHRRGRRAAASDDLLGRAAERACIRGLLADAHQGRSGVLILRGPSGIGKTALLAEAVTAASGLRVVHVVGDLADRDRPYGGLAAICEPFLHLLDDVPEPESSALRYALGMGGVRGDLLAVSAATLWLVDVASRAEPLLICVDGADFLDEESQRVIEFVAGRLDAEGIALVLAVHGSEAFAELPVDEIPLPPLGSRAAKELLERIADLTPSVAERIAAVAGGNPLALLVIPASLSAAQRRGEEPLGDALATRSSAEQAYLHRLLALPEPTQRMLLIAGLAGTRERDRLGAAWRAAGLDLDGLRPALDEGLAGWTVTDRFEFAHPLVRTTSIYNSQPSARRAAHAALAETARDAHARAWHAARAIISADERVALELCTVADEAADHQAFSSAARAYDLAARLTYEGSARVSRTLAAARAAAAAGHLTAALDHVGVARSLVTEPAARAAVDRLHGQLETRRGSAGAARDILVVGAEQRAATDPAEAASMLAEAVIPALRAGSPADAVALGRRARELADSANARLAHGIALLLSGDYVAGSDLVAAVSSGDLEPAQRPYLGLGLLFSGRAEKAASLLSELVTAARSSGSLLTMPYALVRLAGAELELGQWPEAARHLYEAETLAAESGQTVDQGLALGALAWLHAAQGEAEECQACAHDALAIADLLGVGSRFQAVSALGLLELGRRRPEAALEHLEPLHESQIVSGWSDAAVAPHLTVDLVVAYAAAGIRTKARETAERFAAEADRVRRPSAAVAAAICRGVATSGEEAQQHLTKALAAPADVLRPLDRARAQLVLAELLISEGREVEAGAKLAAAAAAFTGLGARPWAERTRTLLIQIGSTVEQVAAPPPLPAAQAAVIECVRSGLSIHETARRLLLTERTVAHRLRFGEAA